MNDQSGVDSAELQSLAGERYRIDAVLGRGGMGVVYAVTDAINNERLALKRARASRNTSQLHSEYSLLRELSHPSIIRVYDYGVDAAGPYYTMELLDGSSLSERGRVHWQEASRLLRDVASSLAVLHSRRLLHRDVTLGNVYCTRAGRSKLLDFGAVTSMGCAASWFGTPPYLPPETFDGQPLDARLDLFALGAALYRMLTGRHAYPAARFEELPRHWRTQPLAPHELVTEVPLALSQLTMALLSLAPQSRPSSAAEVMERLGPLVGSGILEPRDVPRAYLATPALIGRAHQLRQVRSLFSLPPLAAAGRAYVAPEGFGTSQRVIAIRGGSGTGRSRMLDACASEARREGYTVLRASGTDPQNSYGLLHNLVESALATLPCALREPATSHLCELLRQLPAQEMLPAATPDRRTLQLAAADCLRALAHGRPLLLALDDLDRADEPSVACIVPACDEPSQLRVAFTVDTERRAHAAAALEFLARDSLRIELANLTRTEVLELLRSVFGEIPNVSVIAERMHILSEGRPAWLMQLAQQLVDERAIRYEAGGFLVPAHLRVEHLPGTLQDALRARLSNLSPQARELACAFMLDPEAWYAPEELARAWGQPVERWLSELEHRGVLVRDAARFGTRNRALFELSDSQLVRICHCRLATLFARRGDAARAAGHFWRAGEHDAALDALLDLCEALHRSVQRDASVFDSLIARLPPDFLGLLCDALACSQQRQRSKRAEMMLRLTCVRVGALTCDGREIPHLLELLAHLRVVTGLEAWQNASHITEPAARVRHALAWAQARYEACAPHERCFEPREALAVLAGVCAHGAGICIQTRNFSVLAALPSLAPYAAISPTLAMIQEVLNAVGHVLAGRYQQARASHYRILALVDGETGEAIAAGPRRFNRSGAYYALGLLAAQQGDGEALAWADKLERELLFEVPAARVRMTYHLVLGDVAEVERWRLRAERLRIAHRPYEVFSAGAIVHELLYCLASEDLLAIKRGRDELEALCLRFQGLQPMLGLARAEYCRLRGELAHAETHLEAVLGSCEPGRDATWQTAAASHLAVLHERGDLERARALGREYFAIAERADLRDSGNLIAQRLALIEAQLGDAAAARELAHGTLHWMEKLHAKGLRAGLAHEACARVALLTNDRKSFRLHLDACARHYLAHRNPALCARYDRIVREARAAGVPTEPSRIADTSFDMRELELRLLDAANLRARYTALLALVARSAGAEAAALYLAEAGRMQLKAALDEGSWPAQLEIGVARASAPAPEEERSSSGVCSHQLQATYDGDSTLEASQGAGSALRASVFILDRRTGRARVVGVAALRGPSAAWTQRPLELSANAAGLLLGAAAACEHRHNQESDTGGHSA